MTYPMPANETARLQALRDLRILDTPPSPDLDALVRVAAVAFDCPTAVVSLIDADRQWFKARCGIDLEETSREVAFCNYTIAHNKPLIICDATKDERFSSNPLVTGPTSVCFYAGCPLSLDGEHVLGSLCVVDTVPHSPSPRQLAALSDIARAVEGLLRSHRLARLALEARAEAETRATFLRQIERMAWVGAWQLDLKTQVTTWSPQVFAIHDLPVGQPPTLEEALSFYPEPDRSAVRDAIEGSIKSGAAFEFEQALISATGETRRVRATGEVETEDGAPRRVVGVFQDVTEEFRVREDLWRLAHLDPMTGIANRSWFQRRLVAEIEKARAGGSALALMLLDLDGFKEVNDTLGHQAGDHVLQIVADRLRATIGANDFCARLGGDEFAVLVPDVTSETELRRLAERVIAELRRLITYSDNRIFISGSVGVATLPRDAGTPDNLMKCADMALYRIKRSDPGLVGFFSPDIGSLFDLRRMAIELVRGAVAEDRLEPYYQPMVSLSDRRPFGYEALARIRQPDGSIIGPSVFHRAFADAESARQIDETMFRRITADIVRWERAGLDPGVISFNVSDHYFRSENFADALIKRVVDLGISPARLKLEVTETIFLGENTRAVEAILKRIHDAGFLIALDDFGTGYASLTHLRYFPVNCLKIDKSFVQELGEQINSTIIVKAITDLAHNLNVDVVAEGVETEFQAELLITAGCMSAQGHLFGREMPAARVEEMMSVALPAMLAPPG